MHSGFYFFSQYSHSSRIGGVDRQKRQADDLQQALYYVKVILPSEDDTPFKAQGTTSNFLTKKTNKQSNDSVILAVLRKLKRPVLPEMLTEELDKLLWICQEKLQMQSISPTSSKSIIKDDREEIDTSNFEDTDDHDRSVSRPSIMPPVTLPTSLIAELHSTWIDLIRDTEYKSTVRIDVCYSGQTDGLVVFCRHSCGVLMPEKRPGVRIANDDNSKNSIDPNENKSPNNDQAIFNIDWMFLFVLLNENLFTPTSKFARSLVPRFSAPFIYPSIDRVHSKVFNHRLQKLPKNL